MGTNPVYIGGGTKNSHGFWGLINCKEFPLNVRIIQRKPPEPASSIQQQGAPPIQPELESDSDDHNLQAALAMSMMDPRITGAAKSPMMDPRITREIRKMFPQLTEQEAINYLNANNNDFDKTATAILSSSRSII